MKIERAKLVSVSESLANTHPRAGRYSGRVQEDIEGQYPREESEWDESPEENVEVINEAVPGRPEGAAFDEVLGVIETFVENQDAMRWNLKPEDEEILSRILDDVEVLVQKMYVVNKESRDRGDIEESLNNQPGLSEEGDIRRQQNEKFKNITEDQLADILISVGGNMTVYSHPSKLKDGVTLTAEIDAYGTHYDMVLNTETGDLTFVEYIDENEYEDGVNSDGDEMPEEPDSFETDGIESLAELTYDIEQFFQQFDVEWKPGSEPEHLR